MKPKTIRRIFILFSLFATLAFVAYKYTPFLKIYITDSTAEITSGYMGTINIDHNFDVTIEEVLVGYEVKSETGDGVLLRGFIKRFPEPLVSNSIPIPDFSITSAKVTLPGQPVIESRITDIDTFTGFGLSEKERPEQEKILQVGLDYSLSGASKATDNKLEITIPLFSMPIMIIEQGNLSLKLPANIDADKAQITWIRKVGDTIAVDSIETKDIEDSSGQRHLEFSRIDLNYGEELYLKITAPINL